MRPVEEPVELPVGRHGQRSFEHPGFGQITVSRLSGGGAALYGSDFEHHECVRVEIKTSQLNRDLSRDWHFARKQVVEIDMSAAQWATFVSSFGSGSGTPCTIRSVQGRFVPGLPYRDTQKEYAPEVQERIDRATEALTALKRDIDSATSAIPKGKRAALMDRVDTALREFKSNVPFVVKSFGEHMETRVEKAKVEIHGWMTATIQRAGLQAIAEKQGRPLELEGPANDPPPPDVIEVEVERGME